MNKRRIGAIVAASALVAGLAACAPAAETGPVELLVWDTGLLGKTNKDGTPDLEKSFLDQMAVKFGEENPNVTVKVVQQGGDISTNGAQFQAASIAGNGPDVRIQYAGGPTLSYGDFFLDLEGTLDQATYDDMSGWATVRENYDPNGALLGMPYGAGLYFTVFYNKAMLEAAGLDPEDHPKTWEQMMANGQQILDKTGQVPFWVANLEGYVGAWVVGGLLGGELGETASTAMYTGTIPVNDPAMVKVYQAWADFGASGLTNPDAGQASNGDSTAGFVQGKGAYYIVGSWENANMEKEFGDGVGTFMLPMLEGAKYPNTAAGGPSIAVSITNYSKHQDVAKDFLRFLALPANQDLYVKLNQTEASNNKMGDPSIITNPLLKTQAEQLKAIDTVVFPFDSVMPQAVIDLFYKLNASTFLGTTSAQDAADQLQAANQTELSNR